MDLSKAYLVEQPSALPIKTVESQHLPYNTTYQVTVEFKTLADANQFIEAVCYSKSSGIDGDAGAWTDQGDGTKYPEPPRLVDSGNVAKDNPALEVSDEQVHE